MVSTVAGFVETRCQKKKRKTSPTVVVAVVADAVGAPGATLHTAAAVVLFLAYFSSHYFGKQSKNCQRFAALDQTTVLGL